MLCWACDLLKKQGKKYCENQFGNVKRTTHEWEDRESLDNVDEIRFMFRNQEQDAVSHQTNNKYNVWNEEKEILLTVYYKHFTPKMSILFLASSFPYTLCN